jgi:hypothetical protein
MEQTEQVQFLRLVQQILVAEAAQEMVILHHTQSLLLVALA